MAPELNGKLNVTKKHEKIGAIRNENNKGIDFHAMNVRRG
jgi:hypothetical protein